MGGDRGKVSISHVGRSGACTDACFDVALVDATRSDMAEATLTRRGSVAIGWRSGGFSGFITALDEGERIASDESPNSVDLEGVLGSRLMSRAVSLPCSKSREGELSMSFEYLM